MDKKAEAILFSLSTAQSGQRIYVNSEEQRLDLLVTQADAALGHGV